MTNCISPSGKHDSWTWFDAETCEGVRFRIARVSVARRIELARRIREIGRKVEFRGAGQDPREKLEAAVDRCENVANIIESVIIKHT